MIMKSIYEEFTLEEISRLLRLLRWVNVACNSTEEDEKFLETICYKLRCCLKSETERE